LVTATLKIIAADVMPLTLSNSSAVYQARTSRYQTSKLMEENMASKHPHEYVFLKQDDNRFLDEDQLENMLDARGRKGEPQRDRNPRKSIEHHLERRRLKKDIADFDWSDAENDRDESH
jgi:hypothetical protein